MVLKYNNDKTDFNLTVCPRVITFLLTLVLYQLQNIVVGCLGLSQPILSQYVSASKLQDLKNVRQLASDVTQRGASLYHLLQEEPELRYSRLTALSQPLDINKIEKGLRLELVRLSYYCA